MIILFQKVSSQSRNESQQEHNISLFVVKRCRMTISLHVIRPGHAIGYIIFSTLFVNSFAWSVRHRLMSTTLRQQDGVTSNPLWRPFRWAPAEINYEDLIEQLSKVAARSRQDTVRQTRFTERSASRVLAWPPPWLRIRGPHRGLESVAPTVA